MHVTMLLRIIKVNSQAAWKNPDSGNSGVIYPTKTYSLGDQPCREFTQEINIGGKNSDWLR